MTSVTRKQHPACCHRSCRDSRPSCPRAAGCRRPAHANRPKLASSFSMNSRASLTSVSSRPLKAASERPAMNRTPLAQRCTERNLSESQVRLQALRTLRGIRQRHEIARARYLQPRFLTVDVALDDADMRWIAAVIDALEKAIGAGCLKQRSPARGRCLRERRRNIRDPCHTLKNPPGTPSQVRDESSRPCRSA